MVIEAICSENSHTYILSPSLCLDLYEKVSVSVSRGFVSWNGRGWFLQSGGLKQQKCIVTKSQAKSHPSRYLQGYAPCRGALENPSTFLLASGAAGFLGLWPFSLRWGQYSTGIQARSALGEPADHTWG